MEGFDSSYSFYHITVWILANQCYTASATIAKRSDSLVFQQIGKVRICQIFSGKTNTSWDIIPCCLFSEWLSFSITDGKKSKFIQVFQDTWELFLRSTSRESFLVSCLSFLWMFVCLCYITLCGCHSHVGGPEEYAENRNDICKIYVSFLCIHGLHTSVLNAMFQHQLDTTRNEIAVCLGSFSASERALPNLQRDIDLCNDIQPVERQLWEWLQEATT